MNSLDSALEYFYLLDGVGKIQYLITLLLALGALGLEIYALVHAVRAPRQAFAHADKLTKTLWLSILSVATALGVVSLPLGRPLLSNYGFLAIAAVVAAAVYVVDVKPAIARGGTGSYGGYSAW